MKPHRKRVVRNEACFSSWLDAMLKALVRKEAAFGSVLYCGDPHGEFKHIVEAAKRMNASAVVLIGHQTSRQDLYLELEKVANPAWSILGDPGKRRELAVGNLRGADCNCGNRPQLPAIRLPLPAAVCPYGAKGCGASLTAEASSRQRWVRM